MSAAEALRTRPVLALAGTDVACFASDMHLGEHDPDTARWFITALEREVAQASHLFLLGDLFEVWVGDDQPDPQAEQLIDALLRLSGRGLWIGLMRGNRDFLLDVPIDGVRPVTTRSGATLLDDPTLIELFGERVLIAHGDAWCLGDTDYQRFRAQVRQGPWQRQFIAQPLAERLTLARAMRRESEMRKAITDLDLEHTGREMERLGVRRLIHGHTHQPGASSWDAGPILGLRRHVLPDWSVSDQRGGFLKVSARGWTEHAP